MMGSKVKATCVVIVTVLLCLSIGTALTADERPDRVISATGAGLVQLYEEEAGVTGAVFRGAIGLEYEKVRNPNSSFYVRPALTFGSELPGIRATVGIKNYTKGMAPEGFWWGAFGNLGLAAEWGVAVSVGGIGANIGYKYFLPKNFTAEWSLGAVYLYRSESGGAEVGGVGPSLAVRLGYAFKGK